MDSLVGSKEESVAAVSGEAENERYERMARSRECEVFRTWYRGENEAVDTKLETKLETMGDTGVLVVQGGHCRAITVGMGVGTGDPMGAGVGTWSETVSEETVDGAAGGVDVRIAIEDGMAGLRLECEENSTVGAGTCRRRVCQGIWSWGCSL